MTDLLELTRRLTAIRGVSGNEGIIAGEIAKLAAPYADECYTDTLGNLVVHRRGDGKKLLFAAHMDSIGLMATFIEKEGFIRFGKVGGIFPPETINTPIVFQNGVRGVVCKEEKADLQKLSIEDLFIDIGAKDEEDARGKIRVGDTAVFASETYLTGDRIVSPYLDDRIGCLVLLLALERIGKTSNDLFFVFTSQEEVGLRGAKTAAFAIHPDFAYAVDVTDIGDVPGVKLKNHCSLGKGAAIKIMDSSFIAHPKALELLERAAGEQAIPIQRDVIQAGGTDSGAIHVSREGVPCGGISIPTRYIHSPNEMADRGDIEACVRLVAATAMLKPQ